jgi:hypothetical protein
MNRLILMVTIPVSEMPCLQNFSGWTTSRIKVIYHIATHHHQKHSDLACTDQEPVCQYVNKGVTTLQVIQLLATHPTGYFQSKPLLEELEKVTYIMTIHLQSLSNSRMHILTHGSRNKYFPTALGECM